MSVIVCSVTSDPLDASSVLDGLAAPTDGAVLLFIGVVRNQNEGREVGHLDYEAYAEMAERTLRTIANEAGDRWDTGGIRVTHRIGRLEIGEASVVIAVSSPHRQEAYEASRYIIEELKSRAPIWKREGYTTGEQEWLGPASLPTEEASNG